MFKEVITTEIYENGNLVSRDRKVNTDMPTLMKETSKDCDSKLSWEPSKPLRDKVAKCQECNMTCDDSCYPGEPCCYDKGKQDTIKETLDKIEDQFEKLPLPDEDWEIESYMLSDNKLKMIMLADRIITMLIGAGAAVLFLKRLRK